MMSLMNENELVREACQQYLEGLITAEEAMHRIILTLYPQVDE